MMMTQTSCRLRPAQTLVVVLLLAAAVAAADPRVLVAAEASPDPSAQQPVLRVSSFQLEKPLARAQRPAGVVAVIENRGDQPVEISVRLVLPAGMKLSGPQAVQNVRIDDRDQQTLRWTVEAPQAGRFELALELTADVATAPGGTVAATARLPIDFLPPLSIRSAVYIPRPVPVETSILIGAHNCPLWEADKPAMWANILKHPERTPALGFYAQENPEVADWETKWAVEHGVSFFIYCWYRDGQGGAVKTRFGSAIHDALFKSRFVSNMKFTLMWENQTRGVAGVADENDLLINLVPYWIENYFRHPSYLKIDGRPLLFIYRPEFLIRDLGSVAKAAAALEHVRARCRRAGFAGIYLLGEYRGVQPKPLQVMKQLGLDYSFAYCWPVPNSPTPRQAVAQQMQYIAKTQELGILPQVVTVSQAWSGWRDEGSIWKIPPAEFETLLRQAQAFIAKLPRDQLGSRMLLLDNWNEWGEGHYIAPYREYGFGYLDAVRKVFAPQAGPHEDLLPEDIGRGPYDTAYKTRAERATAEQKLFTRRVVKPGADEPGLIAWWAFDEDDDGPAALDWSGHRLGGTIVGARRAVGIDGRALVCDGGTVLVPAADLLSPAAAITVECWVKTDRARQPNAWLVNRVLPSATSAGYRLGIVGGKPCFEIPWTSFSHHLEAAEQLPTGRWVHLAGTFDGQTMKIYVNGRERGRLARPGPIHATAAHLCLGNYELGHPAFFIGLLDEVKIFDRALGEAEIARHYRRYSAAAR